MSARERRLSMVMVALGLAVATVVPGPLSAASEVPSNLRLVGLRGGELTARDLSGGAHVIVVWASWSPRCRDIIERVEEIEGRWRGRARVVSVDFQEESAAVEQFLRGKSARVPVFLDRDGSFAKALEVTTLPGLVVVRDGAVRFQGKMPADVDKLLEETLR